MVKVDVEREREFSVMYALRRNTVCITERVFSVSYDLKLEHLAYNAAWHNQFL
jgi:hypothetical protein